MSIRNYIIITIVGFIATSCNINAQEKESYAVLDAVFELLDEKLLQKIEEYSNNEYMLAKTKAKLNNPVYINPSFSHLLLSKNEHTLWRSPDIKNDLWVIDYIPVFRNCSKNFQIEDLQLVRDSTYYINQVKKGSDSIDLNKITHKRIRHYKTKLEEEKHIKQYESWVRQGVDSITLHNRKRSMLGYENKHFRISYPIFSKNEKYAVVYIEKSDVGMQFWILEKSNNKWKKVCVGHVGTIN